MSTSPSPTTFPPLSPIPAPALALLSPSSAGVPVLAAMVVVPLLVLRGVAAAVVVDAGGLA